LTGGCCTGKSTVTEMFSRLGAATISADDVVHRLLREDEEIKAKVRALFGDRVLADNRSVDRGSLASIVFTDQRELKRLTDLLYPSVKLAIRQFFEETELRGAHDIAVAEVPLLLEDGDLDPYHVIIVVKANYRNQVKRFLRKPGATRADLDRRIKNQMDMSRKIKSADYVIDNSGTVEETFDHVKSVHESIRLRRAAFLRATPSRPSNAAASGKEQPEKNMSER
jgi:dephospho-CoA kinase